MPQFQPILNPLNTPTYIRPGVEDRATAQLIGDVGAMGIAAYQGYQEASLEKAIKGEVEGYFAQNQRLTEGMQAGQEAEVLGTTVQEMLAKNAPLEDVSAVESSYANKLQLYQDAVRQGRMSASELESRVLQVTREAINRSPGLADVLLKRADRTLQLSGVATYIQSAKSAEQAAIKAQIDQINIIRKETGIFDNDQMAFQTYSKMKEAERNKLFIDSAMKSGQWSREQITNQMLIPERWNAQTQGDLARIDAQLQAMVKQPDLAADAGKRQLAFQTVFAEASNFYNILKGMADDRAKPLIDNMLETLKSREQLYAKIATGEIKRDQVENYLKTVQASAQIPLASAKIQADFVNTITQISMMNPNLISPTQLQNVINYQTSLQQYLIGAAPSPAAQLNPNTPDGKANIAYSSTLIDQPDTNTKNVKNFLTLANSGEGFTTSKQYTQVVDQTVQNWLKSADHLQRPIGSLVDSATAQQMLQFVQGKIQSTAGQFVIDYDQGNARYIALDERGNVNEVASARINTLIKAAQSIGGYSDSSKAGDFTRDVLGRAKWEVKNLDDALKVYKAGGMSEAELKQIINDPDIVKQSKNKRKPQPYVDYVPEKGIYEQR